MQRSWQCLLRERDGLHGDFFFSLPLLEPPGRLERIFPLARRFVVEVATHPFDAKEYRFLAGGEIFRWAGDVPSAVRFTVRSNG